MEIDVSKLAATDRVNLVNSLVVPRPIAWVGSVDAHGVGNLAPFSYFNLVSSSPPVVMVAFGGGARKDSLNNIIETDEFVVNVVSHDLRHPMVASAAEVAPDVDEAEATRLATVPSTRVGPPRLAAAAAALECRLHQVIQVYESHVVLGRIEHIHVADEVIRQDRVVAEILAPVARLGGALYTTVTHSYRIDRPTTDDPEEVRRLAGGPDGPADGGSEAAERAAG
ncbi:MAG: flavin reductase family protein [Acidimicrobiaceae bacterium]|nr:flavin reductase family protein [Acidimicrobiaceae bacterium]